MDLAPQREPGRRESPPSWHVLAGLAPDGEGQPECVAELRGRMGAGLKGEPGCCCVSRGIKFRVPWGQGGKQRWEMPV